MPSPHKFPAHANLDGPLAGAWIARELVADQARENLVCLYLNAGQCVIAYDIFTIGAITTVAVDPGVILRGAVMSGGAGLITAHNHPSGRLQPSQADITMWRQTSQSCAVLGIQHVDDLIVTDEGFYSREAQVAMTVPGWEIVGAAVTAAGGGP